MALNGKGGATLVFDKFEIFVPPTFVDYLRAGWQISFVAGIDYTGSNGDPRNQRSLHYCGNEPN